MSGRCANRPAARVVDERDPRFPPLVAAVRVGWRQVQLGLPPDDRAAWPAVIERHIEQGRQLAAAMRARAGRVPDWPDGVDLSVVVAAACPAAAPDLVACEDFFLRGVEAAEQGGRR